MSSNTVELSCVSVYQDDFLILSDVSLCLEKGTFTYLIGKTGSGKSSLLKLLYVDIPLDKGEGYVVGFNLLNLKPSKIPYLRRKIGIVFQDFQLLIDRNVDENLRFVLRATGWKDKHAIKKRIRDVLEKVGMETKGFKMPHQLSGGEQQRIAIARALLNNPELILADEPTGNLDPQTSKEIMTLILDVAQSTQATVLMATHDYDLMRQFPAQVLKCEAANVVRPEMQTLFL